MDAVAFLPQYHALAIAMMSCNGQMNFGLLGFDALPDIETLGESIAAELATLVSLARGQVAEPVAWARPHGPVHDRSIAQSRRTLGVSVSAPASHSATQRQPKCRTPCCWTGSRAQ
jgi:hypothetical protein